MRTKIDKENYEKHLEFDKKHEYNNIMEQADTFLADGSTYNDETEIITTEQKIQLLDVLMDIIRADMQSEYIASFLYTKEGKKIVPFFLKYIDEQGNVCNTISNSNEMVVVSLTDTCVIASPWSIKRFVNIYLTIKEKGFKNFAENHRAIYVDDINVCFVQRGYHSITSGLLHKKGTIQAQRICLKDIYSHVDTNGAYWLNTHTGEQLCTVADFRTAALYSLAKIKETITSKKN